MFLLISFNYFCLRHITSTWNVCWTVYCSHWHARQRKLHTKNGSIFVVDSALLRYHALITSVVACKCNLVSCASSGYCKPNACALGKHGFSTTRVEEHMCLNTQSRRNTYVHEIAWNSWIKIPQSRIAFYVPYTVYHIVCWSGATLQQTSIIIANNMHTNKYYVMENIAACVWYGRVLMLIN